MFGLSSVILKTKANILKSTVTMFDSRVFLLALDNNSDFSRRHSKLIQALLKYQPKTTRTSAKLNMIEISHGNDRWMVGTLSRNMIVCAKCTKALYAHVLEKSVRVHKVARGTRLGFSSSKNCPKLKVGNYAKQVLESQTRWTCVGSLGPLPQVPLALTIEINRRSRSPPMKVCRT